MRPLPDRQLVWVLPYGLFSATHELGGDVRWTTNELVRSTRTKHYNTLFNQLRRLRRVVGQWSACSASCVSASTTASQSRVRVVSQPRIGFGKDCTIGQSEMRACDPAPPTCCMLGTWSMWSACSGTCAPAQRQRTRTVVQPSNRTTPCPPADDLEICNDLPPCDEQMSATLSTQSTTQPQIAPPPPGPTNLVFQSTLVDNFNSQNPQSVELPYGLGEMRAIVANQSTSLEQPYLTASDDSIGCQSGATDNGMFGLAEAPHGFRFEFKDRRAFARTVIVGNAVNARLIGFDRDADTQRDQFLISFSTGDTSLTNDGGFDTWELYADGHSSVSVGLQAFEVHSAIASLPITATTTLSSGTTTIDTNQTDKDDVPIDKQNERDDNSMTIIIASVVVAVLLVMAAGLIWIARRRQRQAQAQARDDLDLSDANFPQIHQDPQEQGPSELASERHPDNHVYSSAHLMTTSQPDIVYDDMVLNTVTRGPSMLDQQPQHHYTSFHS